MHNDTWQLQEAKAKFSAILRAAQARPQRITLRGAAAGVLLSAEAYRKLTDKRKGKKNPGKMTIGKFFRQSPLYGSGIELDASRPRVPESHRDVHFDDKDDV